MVRKYYVSSLIPVHCRNDRRISKSSSRNIIGHDIERIKKKRITKNRNVIFMQQINMKFHGDDKTKHFHKIPFNTTKCQCQNLTFFVEWLPDFYGSKIFCRMQQVQFLMLTSFYGR